MKTMTTRILAAAALCLTSSVAQAAVTYTLNDKAGVNFSWTVNASITAKSSITDFAGGTCALKGQSCDYVAIFPFFTDEDGNKSELLRVAAIGGEYDLYSEIYLDRGSLGKNGVYTVSYNTLTLTVAGIPSPTDPVVPTSPVPEPATWALMLAGFGLTGAALRRRRAAMARTFA